MATISENLQAIRNAKSDIKQAIESKGQNLDNVPFTQYAEKINAIQTGGEKDMLQYRVDNNNSCYNLFYYFDGTSLDISRLDTSNVTTMEAMFANCDNLASLDVGKFNTGNVTNMRSMFAVCKKLTSLDVKNFDTSKVTDMYYMFYACQKLTSLDLSNFNTSSVKSFLSMFANCNKLTTLNVSNFNTSNATAVGNMFNNCKSLTSLDVSSFDVSKCTTFNGVFQGCTNLTYLKIGKFDLKGLTSTQSTYVFADCGNLITIDGEIDMYSVQSTSAWFNNCYKLTNLPLLKNIRVYLQIGSGTSWGHLLTVDSLVNTIKELWDYSSGTPHTLTMGSANKAKLANVYVKLITPTAEQIEADEHINSKMPCEVCASTDEGAMLIEDYANLKNWTLA